MNYSVSRDDFNHAGFISKERQKELTPATQVITYLKNKDKSTDYKYLFGVGECRTRLIHAYLRENHGITTCPPMDEALEFVHKNFSNFKKWLNANLKTY